jgi:hypothetical protein
MPLYLDACAVVKRYVDEGDGGTPVMDAIMGHPASWGGLLSNEWLLSEVTAALARKFRSGILTQRQYTKLLADFQREVAAVVSLVGVKPGYVDAAAALIAASANVRLHSGDALHLHTAAMLRADLDPTVPFVFVTADGGLERVAAASGLSTFNPGTQTLQELRALLT